MSSGVSGRTDAEEGVNAEAPRILGSAGCGQHMIRPASATRKGGVSVFEVPKKSLSKVELAASSPPG